MQKTPAACVLAFLLFVSGACSRPLAVFHWDARAAAMVRKSRLQKGAWGYPKHKLLSGLVCFRKDCLNKAEWKNKQQQHRFRGYKHNRNRDRKPPRTPPDKERIAVVPANSGQDAAAKAAIPVNQVQTFRNVYFESGEAQFNDDSLEELDQLVGMLSQNPSLTLVVSGHTDDVGEEAVNQALSRARAKAVVDYLKKRGISPERLSFEGYGSTRPVTTNDTESGKDRNRRVEFILRDGK